MIERLLPFTIYKLRRFEKTWIGVFIHLFRTDFYYRSPHFLATSFTSSSVTWSKFS